MNTALITARCIFETYHASAYAKYAEHVLLITRFQLLIPSYSLALSISASGNAFMNILSSVIRNAMYVRVSGTRGLLILIRVAT